MTSAQLRSLGEIKVFEEEVVLTFRVVICFALVVAAKYEVSVIVLACFVAAMTVCWILIVAKRYRRMCQRCEVAMDDSENSAS